MGLASKLAAANANAGQPGQQSGYGAPPASYGQPGGQPAVAGRPASVSGPLAGQGQPQYGQQASQYGQQQPGYGAPPASSGQPQYGQQQPQYGAPSGPPPGQSQYGQGAQGSGYGQSQGYGGSQAPSSHQQGQGQGQGQYGQPPQSQHGQNSGQYGQTQGQYGQSQGQYSQQQPYPPQQQHPSGAQSAAGGPPAQAILTTLQSCVRDQNITAFYPPGSLEQIAQRVAQSGALSRLSSEWRLPMEVAMDLCKLALFDTIMYLDDSGSMAFEEGGSRIDDLKLIVSRCAMATSLFDQDGIAVRFMNSRVVGDGIRDEPSAQQLVSQIKFSGLTPLGTALDAKIIQPMLLGPARQNQLQKPILIIAVTDGAPGGEDRNTFTRVVQNANRELQRTRYGSDALSIQLAQVGNDLNAQKFLAEIDTDPQIGNLVDCTSNYELEQTEMSRQGVDLTPELWIVKMLLGAIDSSYDLQDEGPRR